MLTLRLDLDARDVLKGFDKMSTQGRSLGRAFRVIKPEMRLDQKDHAAKRAGPDGPWPARSTGTSARQSRGRRYLGKRRRKSNRRPLGRLVTAITYSASNAGVFATSRIPWSNVHQVGGKVGRGARLPARPFLWISDRLIDRSELVIERVIVRAFEGVA
jgi:phage gpG-like protein